MEDVWISTILMPCLSNDLVAEASNDAVGNDDSEMDDEEPVHGQTKVDSNGVRQMLGEDIIPFEQAKTKKNGNRLLTQQE